MPALANNLSVANDEFDQVVLIKEIIGVSAFGIIEFQNRNREISIIVSVRATLCLLGVNIM